MKITEKAKKQDKLRTRLKYRFTKLTADASLVTHIRLAINNMGVERIF